MKTLFYIFLILIFSTKNLNAQNLTKAYFAGGCFWCMEESFENLNGVSEVVSGYSGGKTKNPTYKEVTYGDTGHFETIEVIYDSSVISYEKLLDNFWINIDPFDEYGQFCDKGYSYRSVAFYQSKEQKIMIEESINKIQKKFEKKVVTFVRKFEEFYKAEDKHQDYYQEYFLNYLRYKKACRREKILNNIWGS
ncbi:peptide-methionine (S)-S-oxide reductase MsrA [Candidatus Pelagibacter sp.]|jgi:methionine-S-sulfoxide reductase|nr:peptide-methionine (S)-S-oxide reductase MsrA [Candidatus Pelagibacter sp.]|tara:strand:- start:176 stop:754 length:579 start_codon:yes stop_codon:yes gene_type:complete